MQIGYRPWGWRWVDEFPGCRQIARWTTGEAWSADRQGKFYIILDESVLAGALPPKDTIRDELLSVLEFDTASRRDRYAERFRLCERYSPRP
jgi:hypothetical protein